MTKQFIPNDEQRPIVSATPDQSIFVQAGAGSGKTATLSARFVNALSGADNGGVPRVDSIYEALMTTFTDNAATEFKERIRSKLNACGMYQEAAKIDEAYISTIHALCKRVLSDNALDLGIDPEFDLMTEESQKSRSQREAVERAMGRIAKSDEFSRLVGEYDLSKAGYGGRESGNSIQGMLTSIVTTIMLSSAGADTLVAPEANPDALASVAKSLEEQARRALWAMQAIVDGQRKPSAAAIGRVDFLDGIIPRISDIARRAETVDVGDLDEMTSLCHDIEGLSHMSNRNLMGLAGLRGGTDGRAAVDALNAWYSWLRAEAHITRSRILYDNLVDLAVSAIAESDAIKDDLGTLDQDDLLRRTYDALTADDGEIADRYKGRFKMVMVDEFQDTSRQQADIMQTLAVSEDGCAVPVRSLATVGDTQQSIYRFRGANVEVMREERALAEDDPDHMVATMSTNYRSHPDILEFVRATCDNGGQGGGLLPDFVALTPDPDRPDDFAGVKDRVRLDVGCYDSFDPEMPSKDTARAASADRIAAMFKSFIEECEARDLRNKTMALLLGAMTHVETYADALERANIPYVVTGGSVFSKRPEVQVVASLLRTIANPGDTESLYRLLASDMFMLGDDDMLALHAGTAADGSPVSRRLDEGLLSGEWHPSVTDTALLDHARSVILQAISEARSLPLSVTCENAIRRSGWFARLSEQGANGRMAAANVMTALRHIREIVDDAGYGPVRGAKAFSEWLDEVKEPPSILAGHDENPVQIMTIHASKGLQFSCVAVAEHNPETRMEYSGLQLSTDAHDVKATLVPSESDKRGGTGWERIGGTWEQRAKVLKNLSDARDRLGDAAKGLEGGIAATTLRWREEAMAAEEEERGRLLYVALTRAEDFLMLATLVHPANAKARGEGQDIAPLMVDRAIRGIEAANEAWEEDGRSVESLLCDDKPYLRIGDGMAMRFGEDGFGRCDISREGRQAAIVHGRPSRIRSYAEEDASGVSVSFVATTERDDD